MTKFRWFKKIFSSTEERNIEEFSKDKLANEKWIEHYFKIGFEKLREENEKEFTMRIYKIKNEILSLITNKLIFVDSLVFRGNIKKNVTITVIEPTKKHYEFLIRLVDSKKQEEVLGIPKDNSKITLFDNKILAHKKEDYLFSPLQDIILNKQNILPDIELGLISFLNIKPPKVMEQNRIIKSFQFVNKEPYYTEFDGIQYFGYPIKKRIELHVKNPKLEKVVFQTKDNNFFFKDFIEEIMSKKEDNEHMRKYCKAVEKLIENYKLN